MLDAIIKERYDRLLRGLGEDGLEKLQNSIVSIVFDSDVAKHVALPFATAGMPLKLISTSETKENDGILDVLVDEKVSARGYAAALKKICQSQNIVGIEADLGQFGSDRLLEGSGVIIDCTTSTASKANALNAAIKNNSIFISASIIPGYAKIDMFNPNTQELVDEQKSHALLMPRMNTLEERLYDSLNIKQVKGASLTRELIASFMGGLIADEAVRGIIGKEPTLNRTVTYKLGYGNEMFVPRKEGEELKVLDLNVFEGKSALVYGAGAIGSNELPWLPMMGFRKIGILEYDRVESSNLIRCPLYHDAERELKGEVAVRKIKTILKEPLDAYHIQTKLTSAWVPDGKYDVYFDGFDNFFSRMLVSNRGIADGTPVISASARFDGFDVEAYVPNKTLCFDCNFGINALGEKDEAKRRQSCGREYTPQNTWLNQSAGALSVLMLANIFAPERYGEITNGMAFYDPKQDGRLFVNQKEGACYNLETKEGTHNVR